MAIEGQQCNRKQTNPFEKLTHAWRSPEIPWDDNWTLSG
jgi:hypothetical protein